jgi:vancomycin permeability regulator SanA
MIFTLSLVSIASRMETKRGIIISFVALYIIHFVGGIVLTNLITSDVQGVLISTQNIYPHFNTLPNPALAVVLCGVFALVAFALSFAVIVYKEKPKKY